MSPTVHIKLVEGTRENRKCVEDEEKQTTDWKLKGIWKRRKEQRKDEGEGKRSKTEEGREGGKVQTDFFKKKKKEEWVYVSCYSCISLMVFLLVRGGP